VNKNLPSLDELGIKHGTDKCSKPVLRDALGFGKGVAYDLHNYLRKYEVFFSALRHLEFALCEIGIGRGRSLRMWKEYFPNATIHGIDIRPECKEYEEERITIHILDGESPNAADYLMNIGLMPLLLIEDGSHNFSGQKTALESFFPILLPGGYYIVEDLSRQMADFLREKINVLALYDNDWWGKYCRFKPLPAHEYYIENNLELICFISTFSCLIKKQSVGQTATIQKNTPNFNAIQHNQLAQMALLQMHLNKLPALAVCDGDKFNGIISRDDINRAITSDYLDAQVGDICNKKCKVLHSFDEPSKDGFLYHPVVADGIFLGFKFEF